MDLLAVQGTPRSLVQHHNSKASNLQHSAFFIVQLSHPYVTTGKTITLTRQTFVGKEMPLLANQSQHCYSLVSFNARTKSLFERYWQTLALNRFRFPTYFQLEHKTVSPGPFCTFHQQTVSQSIAMLLYQCKI